MSNSWISIYDNSQEARLMYVSESITDLTGWEPEQVIGVGGYDFFHPTDHAALRKVHVSNVINEKMSSMVSYRFKCRNGSYVPIETIVHYCHDVLITCNFMYDPQSTDHKMRANTADHVYTCLSDGSLQLSGAWNDRADLLEDAMATNVWHFHNGNYSREKRFSLILNRYSDALNIVYASRLSQELVSLDIPNSIGMSFFDFVPERDVETLHAQIDLAKEHDMIVRIRFDWITDFERGLSEPLEAITSCTDDGLVMVLRPSSKVTLE
ncbi:hypothetical protein INT47_000752 [Mucor saturninus]|uniref:PAS domain-containing protein n=1 Tax=Mucor saturninus TaxID=64648 RepID=A0A8H7QU98_9FUNG|nr:hypothetical protein INT47_000752 [Mucor saturninus]